MTIVETALWLAHLLLETRLETLMPANHMLSLLFLLTPGLMAVGAMFMLEAQRKRDEERFQAMDVRAAI